MRPKGGGAKYSNPVVRGVSKRQNTNGISRQVRRMYSW
jgi:hypothetical protein